MGPFEQFGEICKFFTKEKQKDDDTNEVRKHLQLHDLSVGVYLINKYAIWLDFRMIDENALQGTSKKIEDTSEGITLQIEKDTKMAGNVNAYIYLIMDAQLNSQSSVPFCRLLGKMLGIEEPHTVLFVAPAGAGKHI